MKLISFPAIRALAVCALAAVLAIAAFGVGANAYAAQDKDKKEKAPPQMSGDEMKALQKIKDAPDMAAKLQAATEYVKKYPKSAERARIVSFLAQEINAGQDNAQKITQLESLLTVFKEPTDADVINPLLIDAYNKAQRFDDAFRLANASLARNPNDVVVLSQMALFGIDEARKGNNKFVPQSVQYGAKAIEFIEAGNKPENLTDERWKQYQTIVLGQLYVALSLVDLKSKPAEAKVRIEKAVKLNPSDPVPHFLVSELLNDEYERLAEEYKMMKPGPVQDDKLKQAQAKMDEIVEVYARVVALSEGKPEYQPLHDQILSGLTSFYKYRHKGSTDGMQQLIDKYKKQ